MILTNEQPTPEQGIKRDRWGRSLCPSPFPDGPLTPHLRPSSIAMKIADRWALERWMQRMTARGMALRPDLVALASTYDPDDADGKKALDKVVDQAKEAAGSARGANIGTAIHAYIEQINRGQSPSVLPDHQPAIDAYRRCIDAHGIEPVLLEEFVVWPEMRTAGSCDIYANYQGRMVVMDVKTGQHNPAKFSLVEFGAQFACYGNATHRWDGTTATPLPEVDTTRAYVLWVPSGGDTCELIEVDIVKGRRYVELALEVADAHKDRSVGRVITATEPPPSRRKPATPDTSPPRRTVRIGDLRRRLEKIVAQGVATKEEIGAVMKEAGLPPLSKPDAQTDETVDNWEGIVATFELALKPEDLEQRTGEMISRLGRLPVDLVAMARVEAAKLDPRPPNLTTGRATALDLDRIDAIVKPLELQHAERVAQVTQALSELGEDEAAQVVAWCCEQRNEMFADTIPIESLDNLEAERVVALAWLYSTPTDGWLELAPSAMKPARDLARRHGLPVPESLAELANDRVLTALVIHTQHNA